MSTPKKGRGRPRSLNPLTPAQRAKRYRDKKRAQAHSPGSNNGSRSSSKAGSKGMVSANDIDALRAENARLAKALEAAKTRNNDLTGALELFVDARANNRKITRELMKGLHKLLALDDSPDEKPPAKKNAR